MNTFDRPVPTLAQQAQYTADAVNASGRSFAGLTLTRTLPGGAAKAWTRPFANRRDAAKAVAYCLADNGVATRQDAQAFAARFEAAAIGCEVTHPSGYSFQVLPAGDDDNA